MIRSFVLILAIAGACSFTVAQTTNSAAPRRQSFVNGQKVQVKWASSWRDAIVKIKRGEWYLVQYSPGISKEWVEPWRIRRLGSTEDNIGVAHPNGMVFNNEPPPTTAPAASLEEKEQREKPAVPERAGQAAATPTTGASGSGSKAAMRARLEQRRAESEAAAKAPPIAAVAPPADWTAEPTYKAVTTPKLVNLSSAPATVMFAPDPSPQEKVAGSPVSFRNDFTPNHDRIGSSVISPNGNACIMQHDETSTNASFLTRADFGAGTIAGPFPVTNQTAVLATNADARLVALRSNEMGGGGSSRVEIWSLAGDKPARTVVFYPGPTDQNALWTDRDVHWAGFVDDTHLITAMHSGKVVCWDLATMKGSWAVEMHNFTPVLSPGGKYVVVRMQQGVYVLETLTGKPVGSIPVDARIALIYFSFSPSGKNLCAFSNNVLQLWDVTTGQRVRHFGVNADRVPAYGLVMVSDTHALIGGTFLVDLERRIPVWRYFSAGVKWSPARNGRIAVVTDSFGGRSAVPVDLPTPPALAAASAAKVDDLMLLRPGVKVALSFNVDLPEDEKNKCIEAIKKHIADSQFVLDDAAPVRIVADTRSGESVERVYKEFNDPGGEGKKITVTPLITRLAVESDGKVAWEQSTSLGASIFVQRKEGESLEQAVANEARPSPNFLKETPLPAYVPKPVDPKSLGSSTLGG